jgi:hypothetical protein
LIVKNDSDLKLANRRFNQPEKITMNERGEKILPALLPPPEPADHKAGPVHTFARSVNNEFLDFLDFMNQPINRSIETSKRSKLHSDAGIHKR